MLPGGTMPPGNARKDVVRKRTRTCERAAHRARVQRDDFFDGNQTAAPPRHRRLTREARGCGVVRNGDVGLERVAAVRESAAHERRDFHAIERRARESHRRPDCVEFEFRFIAWRREPPGRDPPLDSLERARVYGEGVGTGVLVIAIFATAIAVFFASSSFG